MLTLFILSWDHPADSSDVIFDLQQWRAGKNQSLNISPLIFFWHLQRRKQNERNPLRVRSWWELKGLKYHHDFSDFFFSFLTCPTSQLFLLSIEICSVHEQSLGPYFYIECCNSSKPRVPVLSLSLCECALHTTQCSCSLDRWARGWPFQFCCLPWESALEPNRLYCLEIFPVAQHKLSLSV